MHMETIDTDVVVIGAGAAGLCAAICAAPRRVLVIAPQFESSTSTELARGGIAAPVAMHDSVQSHVRDTLQAAAHSGSKTVSEHIIRAAVPAVDFLSGIGLCFDGQDGKPDLHLEAGHSLARILHAEGDGTGAVLHAVLRSYAQRLEHIEFMSGLHGVELLTSAQGIAGVLAIHDRGHLVRISARDTVLATGGVGQLFAATTNGMHATGDGLAMAMLQGAAVAGLEFVQFHPTALQCDLDPLPLLTEALRGAGAVLRARGERFMLHVDARAELAPRDIVAREVWRQAQLNNQAGHAVVLDARRVFATRRHEFPGADAACHTQGIDAALTPIPVTCAAHFHMGGIRADVEGRTSLPHLWACGEVACTGLHGANRLASNSLLEAVVVGLATGNALAHAVTRQSVAACARFDFAPIITPKPALFDPQDARWHDLRQLLWHSLGPVREGHAMAAALGQIDQWLRTLTGEHAQLRLRMKLAQAMLRSAWLRRESRGAHWRSDYPERNPRLDGPHALTMPARNQVQAGSGELPRDAMT